MRLKTIALALGAAAAMPSAFADVTLSGNINAGPAYLHQGNGSSNTANSFIGTGPTAQQGISRSGINTNYSNVTIGSMEDLGGGLKLDFAFQIIAPFQGNQGVQNRNSHIGLVGDSWGGVWVGTNEQLYERYMYTVDPLDGAAGIGGNLQVLGSPGFGTVFDQPAGTTGFFGNGGSMIGQAGFYRREENAVWYDSPNWGGFTFGAYTTLSTFRSNATGTVPGLNPSIWGVGAKYVGPVIPVQVWAAYEHHKDMFGLNVISTAGGTGGNVTLPGFNGATSSRDQAFQVGVGYTLGDIFLFGNFERLKYKTDGIAGPIIDRYRRDAWSVGLKWNVPTGYVGAQYIQAQNGSCDLANGGGCNADNTGAKMVGVGYYHTLSKQTQAYVMATYIKNDALQSYLPAGGGDPSGTGLPVNLGGNVWGATVGLKHSF